VPWSRKADCPQTYTDPGKHSIVATYSGTTALADRSRALSTSRQQLGDSNDDVLTSTANPSSVKQQVTYTATVSPTTTADGLVRRWRYGDLGCQSVVLSAGVAKCPQTYTLAAPLDRGHLQRDTSYATSTSTTLAQDVNSSLTATRTKLCHRPTATVA